LEPHHLEATVIRNVLRIALLSLAVAAVNAHAQALTSSALAGAALVTDWRSSAAAGAVPHVTGERAGAPAPRGSSSAGGSVASLSTLEAAALVGSRRGQPAVVILYGTGCPRSEAMFPGFTALAARHAPRNVAFLAFAVDRVAEDVPGFLARYNAPFEPIYVKPRAAAGEMAGAMATIGMQLPEPFNMPHVAVIDASGQVVGEWDGTTNLRAIDAALSSLP
jgi:hypothetical protein